MEMILTELQALRKGEFHHDACNLQEDGELATAAAALLVHSAGYVPQDMLNGMGPSKPMWPWDHKMPEFDGDLGELQQLARAGALVFMEMERHIEALTGAGSTSMSASTKEVS